jgi:hypothetical protein
MPPGTHVGPRQIPLMRAIPSDSRVCMGCWDDQHDRQGDHTGAGGYHLASDERGLGFFRVMGETEPRPANLPLLLWDSKYNERGAPLGPFILQYPHLSGASAALPEPVDRHSVVTNPPLPLSDPSTMETARSWEHARAGGGRAGVPAPAPAAHPTDISLDDLQAELHQLQVQLQEHGQALFGTHVPSQPPPALPRPSPPSPAAPQVPPPSSPRRAPRRDRRREEDLRREVTALRRQLAQEREEARALRALQGAAEGRLGSKIGALEARVKSLLHREETLENKRLSDAAGWRAELTALRQRLAAAERRQRRLAALTGASDADAVAAVLERYKKVESAENQGQIDRETLRWDAMAAEDGAALRACLGELGGELEALRGALGVLENR